MIDMAVARELIDFNASNIGKARAEEQLRGAVAMHNILERYNVAYLADEVGWENLRRTRSDGTLSSLRA